MTTRLNELDPILSAYQGRTQEALLPLLWDVQTAFGQIDAAAVHAISHVLRVPEADIYGVIGFYTLFHDQPTGEKIIRVCTSPSCGLAGADEVLHGLCHRLGIEEGTTTPDGAYTVEHSPCLGMCDHAPAVLLSQRGIGETLIPKATDVDALLANKYEAHDDSFFASDLAVLLHPDLPVPQLLDSYQDYAALRRVIFALSPEQAVSEIQQSNLLGRGGAAFPTDIKWHATRTAPYEPAYVVCNADESEPGTFKDRVLLETRPHLVLEGMAIAAYVIGAKQGYLYIRGEYPHATHLMQNAIAEAEAAGMLGANIMGTDFSFRVEVRRGAGAYICGEETALFESIEGKRGFPRIKPPFPTTHGLFGKPTIINNVETLCTIPGIIEHGSAWFCSIGTAKSTGPKLVSVSGHVGRPGVYEIAPGVKLRELLEKHCGGVLGELQAVLMGGAAGTFLTPDEIDVPLSFEDLRAAGSTFGSGAIMVFNTSADLRDVLRRLGRFFQHESCGKCFPCQLGTQRQLEILERLDAPHAGDRARLQDIGLTMNEASLCGLGQTAAWAVLSAIQKFPHVFEAEKQ